MIPSQKNPPFAPPPAWPADKIEMLDPASLKPNPKNPRKHPPEQIRNIREAIEAFGWTVPCVIDDKNRLWGGHGRQLAALYSGPVTIDGQEQEVGPIKRIPCVAFPKGTPEATKVAYMLAENRIAETSVWDKDLLRDHLKALDGVFDLATAGFDKLTLPQFLAAPMMGQTDPNALPKVNDKPAVRPGDVWVLGNHRIICGSSTDAKVVETLFAGAKPNLMVTDPPYGVKYDPLWREGLGYDMNGSPQRITSGKTVNRFRANAIGAVENDDRADWTEAWQLFPGDVAYVWHGGLHAGVVQDSLARAEFVVRAQIIWAKQNQVFSRGDYHWKHEPCWYAVRKGGKGWWAGDRKQTTVWEIMNHNPMGGNRDEVQTGHGTQKPVECMKRPIENNSKPGDAVYEPFSGSGTTIIAAEMTGRHCFAVELSPAYVQMAIERWQAFTGKLATLDGRTLEQVAKARKTGRAKGESDDKKTNKDPAAKPKTKTARRGGVAVSGDGQQLADAMVQPPTE